MSKKITVQATAYGPPWDAMEGTGVTSTGVNLRHGQQKLVVAVDPRVIPYGTKLRIPNNPFGDPNLIFTASDTGGAIKGNRLDFFVASGRKDQNRWGRKNTVVEIVGRGDPKDVATLGKAGARAAASAASHLATSTRTTPASTDTDAAILDSLIGRKSGRGLLAAAAAAVDSGAYTTPASTTTTTRRVADRAAAATASPGHSGKVTIAPGAERPGVGLKPALLDFLHELSSVSGRTVNVTTGTNHNRMTTTGNVSDHWDGHGADLGVGGDARQSAEVSRKGDLIAAHAIQVAGNMSFGKALQLARKGGVFNFQTSHGRVQILWKTLTGGNHYNHVHIGVRPHA